MTYMTRYIPGWFTHSQTVTHPSTNLAVHGQESNLKPVDHMSDALTITPLSHQVVVVVVVAVAHTHHFSVPFLGKCGQPPSALIFNGLLT